MDALELGLDRIDPLDSGLGGRTDALESGLERMDEPDEHGLDSVRSFESGSTPSYPVPGLYCDNEDAGRKMTDVAEHGRFYENCKKNTDRFRE